MKRKKINPIPEKHPLIAYPKLTFFIIGIIFAYIFFEVPHPELLIETIQSWGTIGIFLTGFIYSFGFAAPFAVGLFLKLSFNNILFASIIGALGSLASDMILFLASQHSLRKEITEIEHSHPLSKLHKFIKKRVNNHFQRVGLFTLGAIFIASPLPDEIGVTLLGSIGAMHKKTFMMLSFFLHVLGIYAIIALGA